MSNTLIYAMSTIDTGCLKVEHFNELFRHVYMPVGGEESEQIEVNSRRLATRVLESLGYCEFDFEKRTVSMCKPALVLLPDFGLPKALLVGARTPKLVNDLRKAVRDKREKALMKHVNYREAGNVFPRSIHIHAMDKSIMQEIGAQAGIECDLASPAAWKLAAMSAALDDINRALKFEERPEPGWSKRTFDAGRLVFSGAPRDNRRIYVEEYRHPVTKQLYHWIWNEGASAEISRDWGRYSVLASEGCEVLMYDLRRFELAVPVTVPLPCLLARAAALCSGIPPYETILNNEKMGGIPPRHPLQVYSCVPPKIAESIARKLNQKLLYTSFELVKEGELYA